MPAELEPRVAELGENRQRFSQFLRGLNEAQLNTKGENDEFSPKETLAHLVGAETSMLRMAKNWIAERDTTIRPDFDLNFFNQRQLEKRAGQSVEELLADWETAQGRVIELMGEVTPEDLVKEGDHPSAGHINLAGLFLVITTHETTHIQHAMNSVHA